MSQPHKKLIISTWNDSLQHKLNHFTKNFELYEIFQNLPKINILNNIFTISVN